MAKKTVADMLVDTFAAAGVERMYGMSGDSLNGITDSIRRREQLRWIHVRHEETAAFAAGAKAHLTGQLAVCAGSCGPGNLHLINGLYDCHRSRVPVLAIADFGTDLRNPKFVYWAVLGQFQSKPEPQKQKRDSHEPIEKRIQLCDVGKIPDSGERFSAHHRPGGEEGIPGSVPAS